MREMNEASSWVKWMREVDDLNGWGTLDEESGTLGVEKGTMESCVLEFFKIRK